MLVANFCDQLQWHALHTHDKLAIEIFFFDALKYLDIKYKLTRHRNDVVAPGHILRSAQRVSGCAPFVAPKQPQPRQPRRAAHVARRLLVEKAVALCELHGCVDTSAGPRVATAMATPEASRSIYPKPASFSLATFDVKDASPREPSGR